MRAVIFANGDVPHPQQDLARLKPDDTIMAADGGFRHCISLGLMPAYLIGDLDSIGEDERVRLENSQVVIEQYPVDKDRTDLELAVEKAIELGAEEILLLSAIGSRWDHSIANLLLTGAPAFRKIPIIITSGPQDARLIQEGKTTVLEGSVGDKISFVPITDHVVIAETEGLAYPMTNQTVQPGSTLTMSNSFTAKKAIIKVEQGRMLCFHMHQGFEE